MQKIKIPKGNGKFRNIVVPSKEEKAKLKRHLHFLNWMQYIVTPPNACHGFMPHRNPYTCALQHVDYEYTISVDLKDFFDTVNFRMVSDYIKATYKDLFFYEGCAAQGLPTSPAIANMAAASMDRRIISAIGDDCVYTRYADDITISFNRVELKDDILDMLRRVIPHFGFVINEDKTEFMRDSGGRRRIVGMTVDSGKHHTDGTPRKRGVFTSREKFRNKLRSALHHVKNNTMPVIDGKKVNPWFRAAGLKGWVESKEPAEYKKFLELQNSLGEADRDAAMTMGRGITGFFSKSFDNTAAFDIAILLSKRKSPNGTLKKLLSEASGSGKFRGVSTCSATTIQYIVEHRESYYLYRFIQSCDEPLLEFMYSTESRRIEMIKGGRAIEVMPYLKTDREKAMAIRAIN